MPDDNLVQEMMLLLRRKIDSFAWERALYIGCALISLAILALVIVIYFWTAQVSNFQVAATVAAAGLITASAGGLTLFLNKLTRFLAVLKTTLELWRWI